MPELPEVETTRRGISPALLGQRVLALVVRDRRLRWPIPSTLARRVRGAIVRRIERRAKYILLHFDGGTAILHLGMSGSLRVLKVDTPALAHDHWDLVIDNGLLLRFHDPRRFGSLLWTAADPERHPLLKNLAPEPLGDAFDADYLFRMNPAKPLTF